MTSNELRAYIQASPALMAMLPNCAAIATWITGNVTVKIPTVVGIDHFLNALGTTAGNTLLDALSDMETDPIAEFKYIYPQIAAGTLRLDRTYVWEAFESITGEEGSLIDQDDFDAIMAGVREPIVVTGAEVKAALGPM